ncbi:MAG: hypothetical protein U0P45_04545 [Acidimicrobiales bacterium]
MTDPTTPPPSDDELSASIDGELDADRERAIDADPDARARRAQLEGAARAVASSEPAPLDDAQVDDLIATALAEPLAPATPTRAAAGRRGTPWLVAASIVVLLGLGLALIWQGRQDDTETAAKFDTVGNSINAESSKDSAGGAATSGHGAGTATTVAPTASASEGATIVPLGTYTSGAALRTALAKDADALTKPSEDPSGEAPTPVQLDRCAQQLQVALSLKGDPSRYGYATVKGRPVLVYEFAHTSYQTKKPTTLVAAVGRDACDEVVFFERG